MEYYLQDSPLTDDPKDCIARPVTIGVINRAELIEEVAAEGTGITPYEAESLFKRAETVAVELLKKGYTINTPLVNISPSIKGVFTDWNDSFDSERHQLNFNAKPGVLLKKAAEETKMQKIDRKKVIVDIYSFNDHTSGADSSKIVPGGIGEIRGRRIKVDAADAQQGVFLIAADGTETRITVYVTNTDGKLIFQIPTGLNAGSYTLEVRTVLHKAKSLTVGKLDDELIVN